MFDEAQSDKGVCNGEVTVLRWSYHLPSIGRSDPPHSLVEVWLERTDTSRSLPNTTDLSLNIGDDVTVVEVTFRSFFSASGGYACVLSHGGKQLLNHTTQLEVKSNAGNTVDLIITC